MMKPVYFPFTYVPQWVAETLVVCFGQFAVYQPSGRKLPAEMQSWAEANMMDVRVPVQTDDKALAKRVKDFQAFADLHGDSKHMQTAAFGGRRAAPPFFGESAVSRIVTEVKKNSRKAPAAADLDPVFCARVFLEFAHEYDRQNDELYQRLDVNDRRSRELVKQISGETEESIPASPLTAEIRVEDPAEYMPLGRLQAWLRLYVLDPVKSGLFITSSQSIFNFLLEKLATAEKIVLSEGLPITGSQGPATVAWRDSFLKKMKALIENRRDTAAPIFAETLRPEDRSLKTALTLYRVPDQSPAHLFSRIFEDQTIDPRPSDQSAEFTHTLIGLITRKSINS